MTKRKTLGKGVNVGRRRGISTPQWLPAFDYFSINHCRQWTMLFVSRRIKFIVSFSRQEFRDFARNAKCFQMVEIVRRLTDKRNKGKVEWCVCVCKYLFSFFLYTDWFLLFYFPFPFFSFFLQNSYYSKERTLASDSSSFHVTICSAGSQQQQVYTDC